MIRDRFLFAGKNKATRAYIGLVEIWSAATSTVRQFFTAFSLGYSSSRTAGNLTVFSVLDFVLADGPVKKLRLTFGNRSSGQVGEIFEMRIGTLLEDFKDVNFVPGSSVPVTFNGGSPSGSFAFPAELVSDEIDFAAAAGTRILLRSYHRTAAAGAPGITIGTNSNPDYIAAPPSLRSRTATGNQVAESIVTTGGDNNQSSGPKLVEAKKLSGVLTPDPIKLLSASVKVVRPSKTQTTAVKTQAVALRVIRERT